MIIKKNIIVLFVLVFLNGCAQGTAFLGPAYTLSNTGSIYQASLSYGSTKVIEQRTGKTLSENVKSMITENEIKKEKMTTNDKFFLLAEKNIKTTNKAFNFSD